MPPTKSAAKTSPKSKAPKPAKPILPDPPPEGSVHQIDPSLLGMAVRLSEIAPDPANERSHSRQNLDAIRASLTRYGQREPLVVNRRTGLIEAGHGRYVVMQELGWQYAAVVLVEDDAKAASGYRVAANRTAELAEWDDARLLATLTELGGDAIHSGFTEAEIRKIEKSLAPPEPDQGRAVKPTFGAKITCPKCKHEWTEKRS